MPTQVQSDGTIIPTPEVPDHPGPIPQAVQGSHITAAAASVNSKTEDQADALKVLGGKVGGRRRRQTRRGKQVANLRMVQRMMLMRGGDVEVKNVPSMPSAGGVDPKSTFAGILGAQHQLAADKQFDGLGDEAPKLMPPPGGGRRRLKKKKTLKHKKNGTRTKHRSVRKHRGASRRTHRVRYSHW
jgi:hypothetical protein